MCALLFAQEGRPNVRHLSCAICLVVPAFSLNRLSMAA